MSGQKAYTKTRRRRVYKISLDIVWKKRRLWSFSLFSDYFLKISDGLFKVIILSKTRRVKKWVLGEMGEGGRGDSAIQDIEEAFITTGIYRYIGMCRPKRVWFFWVDFNLITSIYGYKYLFGPFRHVLLLVWNKISLFFFCNFGLKRSEVGKWKSHFLVLKRATVTQAGSTRLEISAI